MIIAALDTGMRRGEMLALRFGDIDWPRQVLVLRGATTKSKKTRVVPIGTARLEAVLEYQRLDADGEPKPDTAPVFSNAAGEPIHCFRTAWERALSKADLSHLRWHDLRHECASRLAERGVHYRKCVTFSVMPQARPPSATTRRPWLPFRALLACSRMARLSRIFQVGRFSGETSWHNRRRNA